MTRIFTTLSLAFASILFASIAMAQSVERPNLIVIMADDMGYADAGFTGCTDIETPNLDRLAKSGVVFTQGYVNHCFCAPSRAALMAGRYQQRFGFEDNPAYDPLNPLLGIDPNEVLFPQRLQEAGYTTGVIGKWHLGAAHPFHPLNRGFDYFYGFLGGGHDYWNIDTTKPLQDGYFYPLIRNRQAAGFEGYLTNALSRDAVRFIGTNKDSPFFLFLSFNAPHTPLQAPEQTIAKYAAIKDRQRRVYAAMVDTMDQGIGQVIKALEDSGVRENTLVFFLSDNGGPIPMPWNENYGNGSRNTPFRGGKTNMYEGGIHVPFVASWPSTIPAGTTFDHPVMAIDIARTAVEAAGANSSSEPALEGADLTPFLCGEKQGAPHDMLYWSGRNGRRWAVLDADGNKCVLDEIGAAPQLFHLPSDASEENDQVAEKRSIASRLQSHWQRWNSENVPSRFNASLKYREDRSDFFQRYTAPTAPPQESRN